MNETASSAPKSPSQPASGDYEEVVRKLEMECTVAREEFVNSIKMHADLLKKMGNPKLYTKLESYLGGGINKNIEDKFFTKTQQYEFLSQPEIQNNIRGYANNMEDFLRDFKDLPLDKCEQLLRKATICDHNRDVLMRKEEAALDLYESLMKDRDPYSHADPDVKGLDETYVREALDFIETQGKTLTKIINEFTNGGKLIFPFTASVISVSKASDNYMRMLGPTSHSYSEIKQAFSRFSDRFKDAELSEIQPALFTLTKNEILDVKSANKEKTRLANTIKDADADADADKIKRINHTVEEILTRRTIVQTTLAKLQDIQKDISDTSRISYESYQEAKKESRAKRQESKDSSKRVDIEPGDLRAKKVFSAFVTEETVGPLFYNIFGNQSKIAEMLFFKCPVNSKGELIAVRSGKTPETGITGMKDKKDLKDKLSAIYLEAAKTDPWKDYMRICGPMYRPHADISSLISGISDYPFPRTGDSDVAKTHIYDFEDPKKSFWVNPYTDDKRSLNTVFWFLRNKYLLLTALRNLKSHQRVRTSTSIIDRFNPVAKILDSEKLDIYQGLQELGYGSAEKFMELSDPQKFAFVAEKLHLDESEKTRLKDAITQMTDTRKTEEEKKQKQVEEKAKAQQDDLQKATEEGKSVGILGTLKDVFFPEKGGEGEQPDMLGQTGQPSQLSDVAGHPSGPKDAPEPDIHQTKEYLQLKQEYDELKQKNQQKMNELQEQATIANKAIQYQRDKDSQVKYNKGRRLDTSEFELIRSKMSHGLQGDTHLKSLVDKIEDNQTAETLGYVQGLRNTEDMIELKENNLKQQLELKKQEVQLRRLEEAEALRLNSETESEETLEELEEKLSMYEQQMKRLKPNNSKRAHEMKEDLVAKSKRLRDTTHDLLELQSELSQVRKLKTLGSQHESPPIYREVGARDKKDKKRTRKHKRGKKKTHKQKKSKKP